LLIGYCFFSRTSDVLTWWSLPGSIDTLLLVGSLMRG
jgi:hypothetical protein